MTDMDKTIEARGAIELLREAREQISDEKAWTKGAFFSVNAEHSDCFCALGAIYYRPSKNGYSLPVRRFDNIDFERTATQALLRILPERFLNVPQFNDDPSTTHRDVLDLFDRAIEQLESEVQG